MANGEERPTSIPPVLLGANKNYDRFRLQAQQAIDIIKQREMQAAAFRRTKADTGVLADFLKASRTEEGGFDPFSEAALAKMPALSVTQFAPILNSFVEMEKVTQGRESVLSERLRSIADIMKGQADLTSANATSDDINSYADALNILSGYESGALSGGVMPEGGLPGTLDDSIGAFRKDTGMNIPDSHNNPGNIVYNKELAEKYGGVPGQKDAKGNIVTMYPTVQHGMMAMKDLLGNENYSGLDLNSAMQRYSGQTEADPSHGYGADVLDILTPQDITNFGVDVEAMKGKKMSDLTPDEQDALVTAMTRREGFGASKKKAGLDRMDDVDMSQFKPGPARTEEQLPPKVRKAMAFKKMWDDKDVEDKVKDARSKLRQSYGDLKTFAGAKKYFDALTERGHSAEEIMSPLFDPTAILGSIFKITPKEAAAVAQVRRYAAALSTRGLYEGIIDEYGGSYDDLKKQYKVDEAEPEAEKVDDGTAMDAAMQKAMENFEWNGKEFIFKGK